MLYYLPIPIINGIGDTTTHQLDQHFAEVEFCLFQSDLIASDNAYTEAIRKPQILT